MPLEGAGTLALTGNMKEMRPEFVRGVSLKGYGVSLSLGIGIPIPILDIEILKATCVRDSELFAWSSIMPATIPIAPANRWRKSAMRSCAPAK